MHPCGIAKSLFQPLLHQPEGEVVHLVGPHGVGQHPVCAGGDLGDQIGVSRSGHAGGRRGGDRRVEHHAQRRGAVEGLLVAVLGDRGAVGRIAIHRSGRADHHVAAAVVVGTEFRQVVDNARTHGDGHGVGRGQHAVQLLDERPLGIEFRIGENVRFVLRDARFGEDAVHLLPGHPPRIEVRDHEGAAGGEQAFEHLRGLRKGIDADHQRFGVGRAPKGALYFIHNSILHKRNIAGTTGVFTKQRQI